MPFLTLNSELTPQSFAEIGRPAGGFQRADGQAIALCSDFEFLYWPGRAIYQGHRLRHRLSLYAKNFERLLGLFDAARFPINDVAFHPTQPIAAIGTGSYDGGYMFEGDLWLWNWETGETRSLLGESREVVQCRFVDEQRLAVTLRPRDEEEYDNLDEDEAFETCVGLVIDDLRDASEADYKAPHGGGDRRLIGLLPIDPKSLGFSVPQVRANERRQRFEALLPDSARYEERARAWDVCWLTNERVAMVHDDCHIEVWSVTGEREIQEVGKGFGVQILRSAGGALVHVLERGNYFENTEDRSTLHLLTPQGLQGVYEFSYGVVISTDQSGLLLCRDAGDLQRKRPRTDQVLTREFVQSFCGDLGHYDCFNHFVRLDGGDGLYLLQGTPPSSHKRKRLCRVSPEGAVEPVLHWDDEGPHLMSCSACWATDGSLIRAFHVYDPRPGQGAKRIQRIDLAQSRVVWTREVSALVTSMTVVGQEALAFALTDGTIGLLCIEDGSVLSQEQLNVRGAPTVATALAAHGTRLAVGTIDARLLIYDTGP